MLNIFKKKSLLFVNPDYHCSFMLKDELRKRGWRADIFARNDYPKKLLYREDVLRMKDYGKIGSNWRRRFMMAGARWFYLFYAIMRYRFFFFYGGIDVLPFPFDRRGALYFGESFRFALSVLKFFGKKIIYIGSGCLQQESKAVFSLFDGGNVCNNCEWKVYTCNDYWNKEMYEILRRYCDIRLGDCAMDSTQYTMTHIRYKSLDLDRWAPEIEIPERFKLPPTNKLRVLHSYYNAGRPKKNKNIKGSPYILEALERLKREGYPVEYFYVNDVLSRDMRYYQVQADIVVDQIIYGWWGSTAIETMALGKPVLCYLRPAWRDFFFKNFPEYSALPIVEAGTSNIYEILKKLITDKEYRENKGKESRVFAEQHFDVRVNAANIENFFLAMVNKEHR